MGSKWEDNEEIKIFREYLRIPSVHPDPDYEPCVEFLKKQAKEIGLKVEVFRTGNEKKPVVVLTWEGTEPSLPTILLNSHMDVVPVYQDKWTYPAFEAHIDDQGRIYGRGSQDMKNVGMQYLSAIKAIKKSGSKVKRTIHISFVPDEETGGELGMKVFVETENFRKLNVAYSLDESCAYPVNLSPVFYAERSSWVVTFKCTGPAGHGSQLIKNSAGEKLGFIINKMMELRKAYMDQTPMEDLLKSGEGTTINLTQVSGGMLHNVVPNLLTVTFDIRVAIDEDHDKLTEKLQGFCNEAGGGIELEFSLKNPKFPATKIDDSNPFWVAFKAAVDEIGLPIVTVVSPGATDTRFLRSVGVLGLNFSPMPNTPILLHAHDEFIHADVYLKGIDIYKKILMKVGNI
ncbi:hypothetical protein DMENIID0001_162900 [Sergentomyia squamirostris]